MNIRRIINQLIEAASSLVTGATAGYMLATGHVGLAILILLISMLSLRAGQIQMADLVEKKIDDWWDN